MKELKGKINRKRRDNRVQEIIVKSLPHRMKQKQYDESKKIQSEQWIISYVSMDQLRKLSMGDIINISYIKILMKVP